MSVRLRVICSIIVGSFMPFTTLAVNGKARSTEVSAHDVGSVDGILEISNEILSHLNELDRAAPLHIKNHVIKSILSKRTKEVTMVDSSVTEKLIDSKFGRLHVIGMGSTGSVWKAEKTGTVIKIAPLDSLNFLADELAAIYDLGRLVPENKTHFFTRAHRAWISSNPPSDLNTENREVPQALWGDLQRWEEMKTRNHGKKNTCSLKWNM